MAVKISQTPNDSSPASADYLLGDKAAGGPTTQNFKLSDLATYFWTLANIPSGATSPITRDSESQMAFIASGLRWSGDSYGSTLNASMTTGICYINGRRISISAVTARTFTASKDTYVDILDNGDGTGTLVYTTATNNAASPSLAANSIRIGIVVTGASSIAAATSINQGSPYATLPTTTVSVPVAVCDTLGNLIYPTQNQKVIGVRIYPTGAGVSVTSGSLAEFTAGLRIPVLAANVPTNGHIKATISTRAMSSSVGTPDVQLLIGSTSGQSIGDASGTTTPLAISTTGVAQITADTSVLVCGVCTSSGTVTMQAYNSSLVHIIERD